MFPFDRTVLKLALHRVEFKPSPLTGTSIIMPAALCTTALIDVCYFDGPHDYAPAHSLILSDIVSMNSTVTLIPRPGP